MHIDEPEYVRRFETPGSQCSSTSTEPGYGRR